MTIEEFATLTRNVIAEDGFEGFLPTACYPERQEIAVLDGLPEEVESEPAVLAWAAKRARRGELHLVAFKSSPSEFTVVRIQGLKRKSAVFEVA